MILANGKLYDQASQDDILAELEAQINETRRTKRLDTETVVAALAALGEQIAGGRFDERIAALPLENLKDQVAQVVLMLRRESLEYRLATELGPGGGAAFTTAPPFGQPPLRVETLPLGTLLHIAAGNADGLPVLSLAEGLLTGNVNLLKLPQADSGLSVEVIRLLLELEPALTDFVYVFDTPSTDLAGMRALAACSDGIVVWGGDEAVSAVRRFAPTGAKLMEWGHKLSFCYISGYENRQAELAALAEHIFATGQLLCSSCQVIYLDTACMEEVHTFCREFLPFLEQAAQRHPARSPGEAAEVTLRRYNARLKRFLVGSEASRQVYQGQRACLAACDDATLELSDMFGSCLVKPLPAEQLFAVLRPHKGYLQTAGLICEAAKRSALTRQLTACGLTRIMRAGSMSAAFCGEAHDGEYPLRRYLRTVNIEP